MPLSETWVREYIAAVSDMLKKMNECRETLRTVDLVAFQRAEKLVRDATTEGMHQIGRGTLVMYDPESGSEWKRRCVEYAEQVMQLRDLQGAGGKHPNGMLYPELAAAELIVDTLTTAFLLPEVPEVPTYPEGGAK